jgi:hypothetical protein
MRAVLYSPVPGDPTAGAILQSIQGSPAAVKASADVVGARWLAVPSDLGQPAFDRLDATHAVRGGTLVLKDPA